jgi:hypothetical protein
MNRIAVGSNGLSTREYDIAHITFPFVSSLRSEHPGITALQTNLWFVQIE